jgi:hypothetical protein
LGSQPSLPFGKVGLGHGERHVERAGAVMPGNPAAGGRNAVAGSSPAEQQQDGFAAGVECSEPPVFEEGLQAQRVPIEGGSAGDVVTIERRLENVMH